MLEFIEVSLGRGGRPFCRRCGHPAEERAHRPAFEIGAEVEAACAAWGDAPGPNIAFTGAEPFEHPDLGDIVAATVRSGAVRIRLDTDGTALADPAVTAQALGSGVRHVRVTLLGGSPGVHDGLAGSPGSADRALAGMRLYAAEADRIGVQVSVTAEVPVCRHNLQDLPATVTAAAEAGARHVTATVADGGLDLRTAMPWIAAACDSGTVNSCWVELRGVPYCLGGEFALHLVPLLEPRAAGSKPDACGPCDLGDICGGAAEGASPEVLAAMVPARLGPSLAEDIRRAYVAPLGPGEVE